MIGPIRRHLRRIRYYSASPQRTAWHRLIDAALFTALLLSIPAAMLADYLIQRDIVVAEYAGQIHRNDAGEVEVRVLEPDKQPSWSGVVPVGEFDVRVVDRVAGWPLGAWTTEEPPRVTLQLFARRGDIETDLTTLNDHERVDAEVADALTGALRGEPEYDERRMTARSRWLWPRWLVNAGMWWVMLYLVCLVAMIPARIVWLLARRRAAQRDTELRRRGLCPSCGYDLRGLEFHDRCPECGNLVS